MESAQAQTSVPSIASILSQDEEYCRGLFAALADPLRLHIYLQLQSPKSVGGICRCVSQAQPKVSHHLAVLKRVGLVQVEAVGRNRLYSWAHPDSSTRAGELVAMLLRWFDGNGEVDSVQDSSIGVAAAEPVAVDKRESNEMEDYLL